MYVLQASQHDVALLITVAPGGNKLPKAILMHRLQLMAMTVMLQSVSVITICDYPQAVFDYVM